MDGLVYDLITPPGDWLSGGATEYRLPAEDTKVSDVTLTGGTAAVNLGGAITKGANEQHADAASVGAAAVDAARIGRQRAGGAVGRAHRERQAVEPAGQRRRTRCSSCIRASTRRPTARAARSTTSTARATCSAAPARRASRCRSPTIGTGFYPDRGLAGRQYLAALRGGVAVHRPARRPARAAGRRRVHVAELGPDRRPVGHDGADQIVDVPRRREPEQPARQAGRGQRGELRTARPRTSGRSPRSGSRRTASGWRSSSAATS